MKYKKIEKDLSKELEQKTNEYKIKIHNGDKIEKMNPVELSLYISRYFTDRLGEYSLKINFVKIFGVRMSYFGSLGVFVRALFVSDFRRVLFDNKEFEKMQDFIERNKGLLDA